jgi:hypothetical protein
MQEQLIIDKIWHNGSLPFTKENIFNNVLISPVDKYENWDIFFKKENTALNKNEINDNGFRSDNFTTVHNGKHILFAGCSYTWGSGLKIDEVWSKITYNKISKDTKCSGFFNIGVPGTSIINQIFYIFKYCNIYGNPDIIFLNIPDLKRFYFYNRKDKNFYDGGYHGEFIENTIERLSFEYYYMLEQYCIINGIKLYSFSWYLSEKNTRSFMRNGRTTDSVLKNFKTFYKYSQNEAIDFIFEYKEKNKEDKFLDLSRDKDHLGTAYHAFWSQFILDKFYC